MFGFEHSGVQPDLVTVAKSLAGGFPISGVIGKAEIMEAPMPGGLGGTYGGNAVACAAALAVLDAFEQEGLVERAAVLGEKLLCALEALKAKHVDIGVVRGVGFMRAIEFVTDPGSKEPDPGRAQQVMERARERGLLVIKCGVHRNIVRFLAPIVLTDADFDEAMRILADALDADKVARTA
jgi:4-aminobutyrate aminotransferase/(S)-3-amino-2-methylpropionate transaminase